MVICRVFGSSLCGSRVGRLEGEPLDQAGLGCVVYGVLHCRLQMML